MTINSNMRNLMLGALPELPLVEQKSRLQNGSVSMIKNV